MIKLCFYNTLIFIGLLIVYTLIVFLGGYATGEGEKSIMPWILFAIVFFMHLVVNFFLVKDTQNRIITYTYIVFLYIALTLIYQT